MIEKANIILQLLFISICGSKPRKYICTPKHQVKSFVLTFAEYSLEYTNTYGMRMNDIHTVSPYMADAWVYCRNHGFAMVVFVDIWLS